MKRFFILLILCGLIVACSSTSINTPALVPEPTNMPVSPSLTLAPTRTPVPPTRTALPPTATDTLAPPTGTPLPACITLMYEEYAQFEIVDPTGQRILVDIYDPERLSSPVSAADILLTTHTHWDHYNLEFQAAFPGAQLFLQADSLDFLGGSTQGLASVHNIGDRFKPEGGTNYIYVIEIGELRIAHFGDIGQNTLTEEQLSTLGQIDIALTQLNNPYSDMNAENRKGINLMEQLRPRLIIPTHLNLDTVKLAIAQWDGFYSENPSLQVCESDLSENGTQILLMGEAAGTMVKYMELAEWENQ